jgi:predicted SAM-dependent methyltransferase
VPRIKLDIGCGERKRDEDYIGVDAYVESADVKADMWALPYQDGEVDSIWSAHALEHIPAAKVPQTLKEWCRVLRPGGRLIVQVPDFDYVAKYWLTGPDRSWAEALVFGHQAHEGEYHKCAFTKAVLKADLEAAGFEVKRVELRFTHNQETLQAVAVKPAEYNRSKE